MANLAKYGKKKKFGSLVPVGKPEKVNGPATLLIEHGAHAVAGIATREVGDLTLPFVNIKAKPDTIGVVGAGLAYVFGGKKLKKIAYTAGKGFLHAIEGRMIYGSDQMRKLKEEKKADAAEEQAQKTSGPDLESMIARVVEKAVSKQAKKFNRKYMQEEEEVSGEETEVPPEETAQAANA